MKHLLALLLLAAFSACQSEPPTVPTIGRAVEAQARRDSTKAAHSDSLARVYRDLGQAYADSANFYHAQSTHAQAVTTDSAALARFFAGY